jgi:hypothetical protein
VALKVSSRDRGEAIAVEDGVGNEGGEELGPADGYTSRCSDATEQVEVGVDLSRPLH